MIGAGSDYTAFLNYAGIPVMDIQYVGTWVNQIFLNFAGIPVMEIPVMEIPVMEIPVMEIPVMEIPVMEIPVILIHRNLGKSNFSNLCWNSSNGNSNTLEYG